MTSPSAALLASRPAADPDHRDRELPQPSWLVDRGLLVAKGVPAPVRRCWRIPPDELDEALDAATLLAIHDQVTAGIDIVTDGEIRRESYFNHFANALDGVARDRRGAAIAWAGDRGSAGRRPDPARPPVELAPASSCAAPPTGRPRSPCRARSR